MYKGSSNKDFRLLYQDFDSNADGSGFFYLPIVLVSSSSKIVITCRVGFAVTAL